MVEQMCCAMSKGYILRTQDTEKVLLKRVVGLDLFICVFIE